MRGTDLPCVILPQAARRADDELGGNGCFKNGADVQQDRRSAPCGGVQLARAIVPAGDAFQRNDHCSHHGIGSAPSAAHVLRTERAASGAHFVRDAIRIDDDPSLDRHAMPPPGGSSSAACSSHVAPEAVDVSDAGAASSTGLPCSVLCFVLPAAAVDDDGHHSHRVAQ